MQIAALRRVFGEEADGEGWIATLPRRGYRYIGPVTASGETGQLAAPAAPALALPDKPSVAVLRSST